MDQQTNLCRLCFTDVEFSTSLFGSYCKRRGMVEKILACFRLPIEKTDNITTICYRCFENVERFYDFIHIVKKAQMDVRFNNIMSQPERNAHKNKRVMTSCVREEVADEADYTFSFLVLPDEENEPKAVQVSQSLSSYNNSSTNLSSMDKFDSTSKKSFKPLKWEMKTATPKSEVKVKTPRHLSRDLFESESQESGEPQLNTAHFVDSASLLERIKKSFFSSSD